MPITLLAVPPQGAEDSWSVHPIGRVMFISVPSV